MKQMRNKNYNQKSLLILVLCLILSEMHSYSKPVIEGDSLDNKLKNTTANMESNLPIIIINTNGKRIVDEPKQNVNMGVINNTSGINNSNDPYNEYDGIVGIEIRGQSSQHFSKKSYGFETRTDSGTNNNVSLLGLPPENDWVLHGPYSDKSLMRNVLAYKWAAGMGQYAPRTELCELIIDKEYKGVYVLIEKIKRDSGRVNIANLRTIDTSGIELTGGYIFRIDKESGPSWISPYKSTFNKYTEFFYLYPDPDIITIEQKNYIKNFVTDFEHALNSSNYSDPVSGYRPYIDIKSFIDFFLMNEIAKNVDAYRISSYFYKDKDTDTSISPLVAGPVWDFNLGFGNVDYYNANNVKGWQCDYKVTDSHQIPFWWKKFLKDPYFVQTMINLWYQYRHSFLSDKQFKNTIDEIADALDKAQQRNFDKYPILHQYVWPNNNIGGTYSNEIEYMKDWIQDRLNWMDEELDKYGTSMSEHIIHDRDNINIIITTYPNPFNDYLSLNLSSDTECEIDISIINMLGQKIFTKKYFLFQGDQTISFDDYFIKTKMPQKGIYLMQFQLNNKTLETKTLLHN